MQGGFEKLLTVDDVAHLLNVPKSWVYERTRKRGASRLPSVKMGKYLRFRLSAIEGWIRTLVEA